MLQNMLEMIKTPVTTMLEKSRQEDLKKGAIKGAILSVVLALISVISTIITIIKSVEKDTLFGELTNQEVWDKRLNRIEEAKLFSVFFKQILIYAVVVVIIAAILYIIAKLLKNEKKYSETLSMTNNTLVLLAIGMIVNTLVSLIYAPIGIVLTLMISIYAILSLTYAFKESLDMVDLDKLVLISTGIIIAAVIIGIILLMVVYDISFKDLSSATNIFDLLSTTSTTTSDYSDLLDF